VFVQASSDKYRLVQLQSWFPDTRAQYWIVKSQATAIPQRSSSVSGELRRLEQQEIRRLEQLEQDHMAQQTRLENS
jgi:hypothetical protein